MDYRIDLAVLSEQKQNCRFGLTLHNLSDQDLTDWSLHFAFDRFIQVDSLSQGVLEQIGCYCSVTPDVATLKANHHFYCEFSVQTAPFRFLTDGFNDAFIQINRSNSHNTENKELLPVVITPIVLASPYREREDIPQVEANKVALIPQPNKSNFFDGYYRLSSDSQITLKASHADHAATWLQEELEHLFEYHFKAIGKGDVLFRSNPTLDEGQYVLNVDRQGIRLESGTPLGFTHACATLLQLITRDSDGQGLSVPYCKISDSPRFRYRGMMLDCARHFHPVDQVKRLINHLAHYKFNTFHWHLTDDEGWRIEIKAFPQLTKIGAWRGVNERIEPQYTNLATRYGGFYTQQEIKDVIAYAEMRGITVIPEIDIPGHCRAAIKSLPELLVDTDDTTAYRSIQHYSDNVLNPALEGTYQFLDAVIEEVAQLFPATFIHMGADEVPNGVWAQSQKCQDLMQEHGYQDTKELQGHLFRYAEKKLKALGKRMVGWEEAQHGNKVSKDTVIYSWLSEEAAVNCARQGFDVVLQPAQYTYLDMTQDYAPEEPGVDWACVIPLLQAYHYEPLAEIPESDPIRKRILGIQCALWSEIINNQSRMDYMVFPRLTAMAEACWTEKPNRDWHCYLSRLKGHLPLLSKQGVNFRSPWKN